MSCNTTQVRSGLYTARPTTTPRWAGVRTGHETGGGRSRLAAGPGQNGRMDLGLRDRAYLVTGGSRGLGFAAAQALVAEGARVLISAPHQATASAAAARLTQGDPEAAGQVLSLIYELPLGQQRKKPRSSCPESARSRR